MTSETESRREEAGERYLLFGQETDGGQNVSNKSPPV